MSFFHALKWSFLAELASKAITPIIFIVLARLLTPEDFGVMSAALMVIAFSQIFWEAGMGKALIQRQTDVEAAANVAFWINLCLGLLIAGLLFWGAQPIALTFFQDARVTAVLQVMTLQVLLGALSSVQSALLQKEMGFKKLFWVRMSTVALPGFASIPIAWNGLGYWALVAGTLIGQAVQVIVLWRMSKWRPQLEFYAVAAIDMLHFSKWVFFTGFFTWFFGWLDTLVVGYYFSLKDLGVFRVGNQVTVLMFGMIFSFANPVLYSKFSSLKKNHNLVKEYLLEILKITPVISLPLGLILIAYGGEIEYLLGEQWKGVGLVVSLIASKEAALWIWGYYQDACRATGKPGLETLGSLASGLIHVSVLLIAAQYGFEAFLYGRAIVVGILSFLLHFAIVVFFYGYFDRVFKRIIIHLFVWLGSIFLISGGFDHLMIENFILYKLSIVMIFTFYLIYVERVAIMNAIQIIRNKPRFTNNDPLKKPEEPHVV